MMEAYIQRHKYEKVMDTPEDIKKNAEYSCSDPRLHPRARAYVNRFTQIATERHQGDFESLHKLINDYIEDHHSVPYVIILQLLAMRYLGAGLLETEHLDWDYPHRRSKSLSCMFCGTWVTGIEKLTASAHCLNTWRSSDHISDLISIPNTNRLGTHPCTTFFWSLPSRTSPLTYLLNCEANSLF